MADTLKSKTITYEDFLACAREFLSYSEALGDGWKLVEAGLAPNHVVHYLSKKSTVVLQKAAPVRDHDIEIVNTEEEYEDAGVVDLAIRPHDDTEEKFILTCEYHVIYSSSYQVPVLYFTACYCNGKLALLNDLWELLPINSLVKENGKWGVLTDTEHPFLLRPFYHIHPCHTAKMMAALGAGDASGHCDNYVLAWLSVFGPLVGLSLSLEYGKQLLNKSSLQ